MTGFKYMFVKVLLLCVLILCDGAGCPDVRESVREAYWPYWCPAFGVCFAICAILCCIVVRAIGFIGATGVVRGSSPAYVQIHYTESGMFYILVVFVAYIYTVWNAMRQFVF